MYQKENKNAFKFTEFCNYVKDNQNWKKSKISDEHIVSGSKRSRTFESEYITSGAHIGIDLNDDETVQVTPPSRLMGRDEAKRKDKGKAVDSDDLKVMEDEVNGINERIDKILQIASKRDCRKQRDSDMKILSRDTSHLTGEEL